MEMDKASEVATPKSARATAKKRQSMGTAKNLVKEVHSILAEDDSSRDDITTETEVNAKNMLAVTTPKSRRRIGTEATLLQTPKSDAEAHTEQLQTPRRSVRKSIKPIQDYEDIVSKKSLCSSKKSEKQSSVQEETEQQEEKEAPKWTPAKVGRVSQKRKSRKHRKVIGNKQQEDGEQRIQVDVDVLEVIANDEDENKENVEPQELFRNRKSPKDNENKDSTRRSQETSLSAEKAKVKHAGFQSQPLNSLVPEEVRAKEQCSPKASHLNTEHVKKSKQTESQELSELGLNPIALDEPDLQSTVSYKQQEEASIDEIKTIGEPDYTKEAVISVEAVSECQTENIVSPFLQCKESANSTFDANNSGISTKDMVKNMDSIPSVENALGDKRDNFINTIPKELNISNTTLDSSDCIIISPEVEPRNPVMVKETHSLAPKETNLDTSMPSLLISDDEEPEAIDKKCDDLDIPKIFVNNVEQLTPQKATATKINIVAPIVATSGTPKMCKTKPYRFPTPYKSRVPQKNVFEFNSKQAESGTDTDEDIQPPVLKVTSLEAKEIVLRSIRKRSLSVCNDRPPRKQFNRVTFHSPANQTTVIDDLDLLISNSTKKGVRRLGGRHMDSMVSDISNVTKRRKRSLSVDESLMMARLKVHQAPLTPSKLKITSPKLQSRTKIPNFAAIHQRQFKKMENLVDHVTRKAERAKVLTTSGSKLRGMSAQKSGFSSNNQNIEPSSDGASGTAVAETSHARVGRPKALKKIDLSDNTIKPTLSFDAKKSKDDENEANSTAINLPNPQLHKNFVIVQPMPSGKKLQKMQPKKIFKPSQPIQMQQPKPAFNLSTNIKKQTANSSMLDRTATMSTSSLSFMKQPTCANNTTISATATQSLADKVSSRRQRHMDMFKGRGGVKASRDMDKSSEIIRGVRSNRRFDLQMQHRKNLNHDHI